MKLNRLFIILTILVVSISCKDGYIDEISNVPPGADMTAPVITLVFPAEGSTIKVGELITTLNIDFKVSDDIEVKTISVTVDGNPVGTLTDFIDYRKVVIEDLKYPGVANGTHTMVVTATDVEGKTTTVEATFVKEPPYVPIYAGEVFYMSFDTDVAFKEMITFTDPTIVGTPDKAGAGAVGTNAYKGKADSYLTTSTAAIDNAEFSAIFWMKVNNSPDRAGILAASPDEPGAAKPNNHASGFRFFREDAGGKQRFKLNIGDGVNEHWFDGGPTADVTPNTDEWVNFAFTISPTRAVVYIDGEIVSQGDFPGMSWTGADLLSIMSGAPRFTGWDHFSDQSIMDELRFFDRILTKDDIQSMIADKYQPYEGEEFYLTFNGNYNDFFTGTAATVVGSPDFADESVKGKSYEGAVDAYLTFPTTGLQSEEFSAAFWMKVNASPLRAGILVMGPPDPVLPATPNNRKTGFRFFREDAGTKQRFKLNVGDGEADWWFDGGAAADVDPAANEWVHFAFTISATKAVVYINGDVVSQGTFPGVDWTGADILSIMSGDPRFMEWGHHSDESLMDELHIFSKALTEAEVENVMNGD
jgi:hypothetical protein